jgi:hypothetical protein
LFYRREKNINYLLNEYDEGNRDWLMKAVFYKGKYIMADGMHRSSVLKHNGYRKIFVKIISGPTEPTAIFERFITDERFREPKEEAKLVVNGMHLIGKVSLIKDVIQFGIGNDEVFKTNHSLSSKIETLLQILTDIEGELNITE